MKHSRRNISSRKVFGLVLSLILVLSSVYIPATQVKADATVGSSWTENPDGTLSLSDTAANKAVGSLTSGHMILIGTIGGTISSLPSGDGIVTKISSANNAAMIRYTGAKDKTTLVNAIKAVKFTSATTQVHIDVTYGNTSESMTGVENFGVLNADGEAHVYKLMDHESSISWIQAFSDTVNGSDTLGGLKGYLATVTTSAEADLVKNFYNSSENGTWIAGTSLRYSTDGNTDYSSAGKITPTNYSDILGDASVSGQKIVANTGAYYCPFGSSSVSPSSYYNYYYWACGPEQGQTVSTSLWAVNEPNNSDSGRQGETCIVSPWGGNAQFNDFSPFNNGVKKYFIEFSAYAGGMASGSSYNSITIYKVALDGNGATGSIAPMEKFKGENLTVRTDYDGLTPPSNGTWFAGWYGSNSATDYTRVNTYTTDAATTLYAHWSKFGYSDLYDPVAATGLVYNGSSQQLIDTTDNHGIWRINSPSDGASNNYTYWYSTAETTGYVEGTLADSSKTSNVGYGANLNTGCTPLYETEAGTYTIYWNWDCKAGSAKMNSLEVTIAQKPITDNTIEIASESTTFTYNGKSQTSAITITDTARGASGTVLTLGTDYSVKYVGTGDTTYEESEEAPANAGTYKAIITGKGNYKDTREVDITINPADINIVTVNIDDWTYGQKPSVPTSTATFGGDTVKYSYSSSENGEYTENVPTEVGKYYIKASVPATKNYGAGVGINTFEIKKPVASISTKVNVSKDSPAVIIKNLTSELALKLLTAEEKDEYEKGTAVLVYMDINALSKDKVPAKDIDVIEDLNNKDGYTYGECIDISLWKKIGDKAAVQIHDTNGNPINMSVAVSDKLKEVPEGYSRTYRFVRVHEGTAKILAQGKGPNLDASSDKFSSYFIVYKDVKDAKVETPKNKKAVITGDDVCLAVVILAMLDSAMAIFYLTLKKRKLNKR